MDLSAPLPAQPLIQRNYFSGDEKSEALLDLKEICKLPNATRFPQKQVVDTLRAYYGERIVKDLLNSWEPLPEQVAVHDFQKLLVGIAARVQRADLAALFEQVRFGTDKMASCAEWLSEEDRFKIRQADNFEQLDEEQLTALSNLYRHVFDDTGERVPVAKAFFPRFEITGTCKFEQSLDVVRAFEVVERYEQTAKIDDPTFELRQKLAGSEHMAREIAYTLPDEASLGLIVPLLDEAGKTRLYTVAGVVVEKGLFFFVFVPTTKAQWQKEALCPVRCAFRGSNDRYAWKRNLTEMTLEAGRISYFAHEPKIIQCLKESLPDYLCELVGSGHSLAGAEMQRLAVSFFKFCAQADAGALLRVQQMKIFTWCPASLVGDTLETYNQAQAGSHLGKLEIHHSYVDEDIVPGFGVVLLGYRNPDAAPKTNEKMELKISMTKFTLNSVSTSVGTTLVAHRTPLLIDNGAGVTISEIPEEEINRKLGPRGFMRWCLTAGGGLKKNIARAPVGTMTIIRGIYRYFFPTAYMTQGRQEPLPVESFHKLDSGPLPSDREDDNDGFVLMECREENPRQSQPPIL